MDGFTIGTYDVTDIESTEGSTAGTTGVSIEGLFLGDWTGSLDGLEIGKNVGNELVFSDGKVLCTIIEALYGISIFIYDGKMLISLEG